MAIAFPGAEGYGAVTQGARAGSGGITVYRVTNLNDSGAGSFRAACEASGRRVVIFDIGGVITVDSIIEITDPYITILGQTAPGDGICLTRKRTKPDPIIRIRASEVIMRYLRLRGGAHPDTPSHSGDCLQITADTGSISNIIIDHCSFSWGSDETIDQNDTASDVTIQWCIISDAIALYSSDEPDYHNFGVLFRGKRNSLHHCLLANCRNRLPKINQVSDSYASEVINNIIYNGVWRDDGNWGASHVRRSYNRMNYINNVVKIGLDRDSTKGYYISGPGDIYEAGTQILENDGTDKTGVNGYDAVRPGDSTVGSKISVNHSNPITVENVSDVWTRVLEGAGATIPKRDAVDLRAVSMTLNGTGHWINDQLDVGGLPSYSSGTAWIDTDADGVPDSYEEEVGSVNATDTAASGYLYIEEWANGLASDSTPSGGDSGGDGGGGEDPTTGGSGGGGDLPAAGDISIRVSASADDAYVQSGTGTTHDYTATRVFAGHMSATEYNIKACMRFVGVDILNGSSISEAYLKLYQTAVNGTSPTLRIYAIDEDDSDYLDDESDLTSRLASLTTAYVEWTPTSSLDNEWTSTPNISNVIEEVVARPGWVTGNSLTIVIQDVDTSYSVQERVKIAAYDADSALAARLDISGITAPQGTTGSTTGTVDIAITDGTHDGYARLYSSKFDNSSVNAYAGDSDVTMYWLFLHWPTLGIPQGMTIDTAYMTFEVSTLGPDDDPDLIIYAEDVDDADIPASYADVTAATGTTAEVSWSTSGLVENTSTTTPEIKTIIQELVNRASWTENSSANIFIRDVTGTSDGIHRRLGIETYDSDPLKAAQLYIEWSGTTGIEIGNAKLRPVEIAIEAGTQMGI